MPARRNRRSEIEKPAGSIIAASTPRHAQVRIIAPALAAISGSYSASAIGAADMADALPANEALCHPPTQALEPDHRSGKTLRGLQTRARASGGSPRGRRSPAMRIGPSSQHGGYGQGPGKM